MFAIMFIVITIDGLIDVVVDDIGVGRIIMYCNIYVTLFIILLVCHVVFIVGIEMYNAILFIPKYMELFCTNL